MKNISKIETAINQLPSSIKNLEFSGHEFNGYKPADLQSFLKSLPPDLENFSFRILRHKEKYTTQDIIDSLKCLPRGIRTLSLRMNYLADYGASAVKDILRSLPDSLDYLSLVSNNLGTLREEEIRYLFKSLPEGLQSLDLSANKLGNYPQNRLVLLFKSLPLGLKSLSLRSNDLKGYSKEDLGIPESVKVVF